VAVTKKRKSFLIKNRFGFLVVAAKLQAGISVVNASLYRLQKAIAELMIGLLQQLFQTLILHLATRASAYTYPPHKLFQNPMHFVIRIFIRCSLFSILHFIKCCSLYLSPPVFTKIFKIETNGV